VQVDYLAPALLARRKIRYLACFVSYIFIIAQKLLAGNMFNCTGVPYT